MDFQVKKMKVGISTTLGQKSLPSPYHHLQSRGKLLIHPQLRGMTMTITISRCIALSQLF